jgi:hypothetical protein
MRAPFRTLVAALLVLVLAEPVRGPQPAGADDPTLGIRGHWVVEVREADGTPVAQREFHNAVVDLSKIPRLLDGEFTIGSLMVSIDCVGSGCVRPCPSNVFGTCDIIESRVTRTSGTLASGAHVFKNLTVETVAGGLQLRGSAVPESDTIISRFAVNMLFCANTLSPQTCATGPGGINLFPSQPLTATIRDPGIPVVSGQQIQVTVTLTFVTAPAPATPSTAATPR